jgi:hypothetical protein
MYILVVKNELAAAERQYKRTLDTSMSRHRKDMQNKLKTMRTKNPKEFWKIFPLCYHKTNFLNLFLQTN